MAQFLKSHTYQHAALLPLYYILFIIPLANAQPEPTPLTSPCPVVLPTKSRIVGGTLAEAPYMVYFQTSISACSGTLVTKTDILTARHCDIDSSTMAFISSTDGSDGTLIPIESVANHPRDDIMLVRLARPADVEPVKILVNGDLPTGWSFVRAQGYGLQSGLPFPSDARQRFVDFPVIPQDLCVDLVGDDTNVEGTSLSDDPAFPDDYLCTNYLQSSSCTFCSGDSGGAVFSLLNDDPVLVGVISSGNSVCSLPGRPGFSVRVSSYIGWLDEQGVQYDGVTELSETFVNAEGVTNGGDSTARVPPVVVMEDVQVGLAPVAIAGIAVGAAVAVAAVAALIVVAVVIRRRKASETDPAGDGDGGEGGTAPRTTGSSLMPPGQSGPVTGPNDVPPSTPTNGVSQGQFWQPAQPNQPPAQQVQSAMYPAPNVQPPAQQMQPAVYPNPTVQPPTQQVQPVVYPTPTAQPPTQPAPQLGQPPAQPPHTYPHQ